MMKTLLVAVMTAAALAAASGARAATIYSSFGSSPPTFDQALGYGVTGALAGGPGRFGAEFTVPGTGAATVTGAHVAVEQIETLGSNGLIGASFWTVSGGLPGVQIGGSFPLTAPGGFPPTVVSISVSGVTLTGGQSYFLVLQPSDAFTHTDWFANNQGVTGFVADIGFGWQSFGGTAATPVFDVIGTLPPAPQPVPEPWGVLGVGLAGLAMVHRNRGRARRVQIA